MAEIPSSAIRSPEGDPQAIRLTFSYDGDAIELVAAQRLAKFVPRSDPLDEADERSGFWIELCGRDNVRLFRRILPHPIARDREIFPENLHGEIIRQPIARPKGIFSVVIPELRDVHTIHLMASPSEGHRRCEHAVERTKFDFAAILRQVEEYRP